VKQDEAPRSLWDLAQPQWKGKVAMANPQFGTTRTHVAAMFALLGPEKAQELLLSLLANEVRIADGNAMVKNLVARADPNASPVYVGLTDTDDVLAGQAEGEPVELIYPDQETIGTLVIPATVCLVRGAVHRAAAEQLIEYLASPQAAQLLAVEGSGYHDVRQPPGKDSPRAFELSPRALLDQLEPSSRWTQEHFHP
jgi:iron(III) transport system substrate-binding protein